MPEFTKHLAALSPYSHIHRHPSPPNSNIIYAAVYLFRHGVIEVSHYDFDAFISPFLKKVRRLQDEQVFRGKLAFLNEYISWITESHVGLVSVAGARQSSTLGKAFRQRYPGWLGDGKGDGEGGRKKHILHVWCDEADRCRGAAASFATAFSGELIHVPSLHKPPKKKGRDVLGLMASNCLLHVSV